MKNKTIILLATFAALNANADVPNTFSAGQKAVASDVNENFNYLDARIDSLQERNSNSDTNLPSFSTREYTYKSANIGDVIATISNNTYVLGALPFKEFGTGKTYKVILPMLRIPCVKTTDVVRSNTKYISNYQCVDDREYYYSQSMYLKHVSQVTQASFSVSGFPAAFLQFSGENASISLSSDQEIISSSSNTGVEPPEYTTNYEVTPDISVNTNLTENSLFIQVGETSLNVKYEPSVSYQFATYNAAIAQNTGPDFSLSVASDDLNKEYDLDLLNQYRDLYNYISIQEINLP